MSPLGLTNPSVTLGMPGKVEDRERRSCRRWSDDTLGWIQECECGVGEKFCVCEIMDCQRVPDLARDAATLDTKGTEPSVSGSTLRPETKGQQAHDAAKYRGGSASAFDDMSRLLGENLTMVRMFLHLWTDMWRANAPWEDSTALV